METQSTEELARSVRIHVLRMVHHANASHAGTALSIVDILAVLYGRILRIDPLRPDNPNRDRLVVSKGHSAAAVYSVLAEQGFFPTEWLQHYCDDNSPLAGHLNHIEVPGVEVSTGSLGHGLSIACGLALGSDYRTFAVLSDGEMNEGSVWESILFAGHHKLSNLTAIIDYNKIQSFGRVSEILDLEPLENKFSSFGWDIRSVDGHDHKDLVKSLKISSGNRPCVVLAHTVKGKGVSFMEDRLEWHYHSPDDDQLDAALRELGEKL